MTAANLVASVASAVKGKSSPPILAGVVFKSDPLTARDLCKTWAAEVGAWHGNGKATPHGDDRMYTPAHYVLELYGDSYDTSIDGHQKRPLPKARVWIHFRASVARASDGAPHTSHLALEMKDGEWRTVEAQVNALLATLRQDGWLIEARK